MFSFHQIPDAGERLSELAEAARYDVCLASCSSGAGGRPGRMRDPGNPLKKWIYPASVPGRGWVQILKVLQSNSCRNNCTYCRFAGSNSGIRRTSLKPHELADAFMKMVSEGLVEGLFLSSGVRCSAADAMADVLRTAEILRFRYRFRGYIHLKIIPGCLPSQVDEAVQLADRVSVNLEAPVQSRLDAIAPDKDLNRDILTPVTQIAGLLKSKYEYKNRTDIRATSQTTQFVIGAADETDREVLNTVEYLYSEKYLFRSYFSAFQDTLDSGAPKRQSGFEGSPLLREHRLYQCDFLMRAYGFRFPDLVFDSKGNIPLETDPKTAWAVMNPEHFPVEINTADRASLLRVPGIGPVSADRIIALRKKARIREISELKAAGAWADRAAGWIEICGRSVDASKSSKSGDFDGRQGWLFEQLAPEDWKKAGPALLPAGFNAPEKKETGPAASGPYPAQKGRWVNYLFTSGDKKVYCS